MDAAMRGRQGPFNVRAYVAQEGGIAEPSQWLIRPSCAGCGAQAYLWGGALRVRGYLADLDGANACPPDFRHFPKQGDDCAYARKDRLAAAPSDAAKERQALIWRRNAEVLLDPAVRGVNAAMFRRLMMELTGAPELPEADRAQLHREAREKLYREEYLADHPWLLPFMLAPMAGYRIRKFPRRSLRLAFREGQAKQEIRYSGIDGSRKRASIPAQLQLHFVRRGKNGVSFPIFRYRDADGRPSRPVIFDLAPDGKSEAVAARPVDSGAENRHCKAMPGV